MKDSELLEQHEGRLRLYVGLLSGMPRSPGGDGARQTIVELVRREVAETERIAESHLRRLSDEDERDAFRYALTLLLPYYTHLVRLYGGRRHGARAA